MTEQEENELICEKLLGWERWAPNEERPSDLMFRRPFVIGGKQHGYISERVPTFTDWASAGLILDALQLCGYINIQVRIGYWRIEAGAIDSDKELGPFTTGPLAIRAAALEYIRAAVQASGES